MAYYPYYTQQPPAMFYAPQPAGYSPYATPYAPFDSPTAPVVYYQQQQQQPPLQVQQATPRGQQYYPNQDQNQLVQYQQPKPQLIQQPQQQQQQQQQQQLRKARRGPFESSDYGGKTGPGAHLVGLTGGALAGFAVAGPFGAVPGAIIGAMAPAGIEKLRLQHQLAAHDNPLPVGGQGQLAPVGRRRRAVVIGVVYRHLPNQTLPGCANDAANFRDFLQSNGFTEITSLIETHSGPQPTQANIYGAINWLVSGAAPGDSLVFYYSGHGLQRPTTSPEERDGLDELIVPMDERLISDDELLSALVTPLPEGSRLTAVFDCCHGGTMLDLPYSLSPQTNRLFMENPHSLGVRADVVALSATRDAQLGAERRIRKKQQGVLTFALLKVIREKKRHPTYAQLLQLVRREMIKGHLLHKQTPELTCSKAFDLNQPFTL